MLKFDSNGDCFASLSENQIVKVIICLTTFSVSFGKQSKPSR